MRTLEDRMSQTDEHAMPKFSYALNRYADPTQLYPDSPPMSLTIVGRATAAIVWSRAARKTKNFEHGVRRALRRH